MEKLLNNKIQELIQKVTNDTRWNIQSETQFQIFGLTLSGFAFGVVRNICFLDAEDIKNSILKELTAIGAGEKYVEGLIDTAFNTFENETKSTEANIVSIGYSHFSSNDLTELKNDIFSNTDTVQQQKNALKEKPTRKWWKFGRQ